MILTLTAFELEALHKDFPKSKVDRQKAKKYDGLLRGSVRMMRGLYRTEDEREKFIRDGLALRLPQAKKP